MSTKSEARYDRRLGALSSALLIAALLLVPYLAFANPGDKDVHVSLTHGSHGSHTVEGRFSIHASTGAAWSILTDYDHMSAFVSSIRSSRRVKQTERGWIIDQVMTGKAGLFRKRIHLLLDVRETPPHKIEFRDTSGRSFKSYAGAWQIRPVGNHLEIFYSLEATPAFYSPDFLSVSAFKRNVKRLLEEVRAEITLKGQWGNNSLDHGHGIQVQNSSGLNGATPPNR